MINEEVQVCNVFLKQSNECLLLVHNFYQLRLILSYAFTEYE